MLRLVSLTVMALAIAAAPCQSCFELPQAAKSHPCCPVKKPSPPCHQESKDQHSTCSISASAAEPAKASSIAAVLDAQMPAIAGPVASFESVSLAANEHPPVPSVLHAILRC